MSIQSAFEAEGIMNLHEFIEKYIARNTIIRLWKPETKGKPYGSKVMLTEEKGTMEWEVLDIPELKDIPVIHITDIVCDKSREAVNIVIDTDYEYEDIVQMLKERDEQRMKDKMCMYEG